MRRILILGQIPDDFDSKKHIPISPTCFVGKEFLFPEFEKLDYLNSYENNTELALLDKLTSEEALFLVTQVAKKYNPTEFDNYSYIFWKTIYYPFLGLLIPMLYRKQLLIKEIIKKYGNENLEVSIVDSPLNLEFENEFNFIIDALWNITISEWVYGRILEIQVPKRWRIIQKNNKYSSDIITINRFTKKASIKNSLINLFKKIFYRSIGIYGMNLITSAYFHVLLSLKPKIEIKRDKKQTQNSSKIMWNFEVEEIIEVMMPNSLKHLDIKLQRAHWPKSGKIINFSNQLYYKINSKIKAAYNFESKNINIATQHGGHNYGSGLTYEFGKNIEFLADYFISWGNYVSNYKLNKNLLVLPSPLLSGYLNKHITRNNKTILVGTDMNLFLSRFDSTPNEEGWVKYRINKLHFLKNLTISNIWYRPYFLKLTSLLDWEYINNNLKKINKLEGKLGSELQLCKLLVLDHPGTTWNIAMAMNTPIICFWDRNHFPFNKEADLFLDKFKELGLFFEDPKEAAEKVNAIVKGYDDLTVWWNQKEIQSLRKEWMNIYAKADKNWFWIWTKTLWNLK